MADEKNIIIVNNRERNTAVFFIEVFFSIFLPPVTAFLERGLSGHFALNILLTLLGWLPGVFHAIYLLYVGNGQLDVPKESRSEPYSSIVIQK